MKIGIFGSAFNPPTLGHADAIKQGLYECDKVILIPSYKHAFNKNMINFRDRLNLVQAFIEDNFDDNVSLSDIEEKIYDNKPNHPVYTFNLLDALSFNDTKNEYIFLCGEDNFNNFNNFENYDYILSRWKVSCLTERVEIRSTMVRENLSKGISVKNLISSSVAQLINKNNYYGSKQI